MGWPQYTIIGLTVFAGGIVLAKHGQPREDYDFVVWSISTAITLYILYAGGFFDGPR